jgi:DNA-binding transcriptional ArsR family regulator
MRFSYHPPREEISLSGVLFALSDPIRLRIVRTLSQRGEQSCSVFSGPAESQQIPKSTLTHHFKVLREAGVIATRNAGTQRFISLRTKDLEQRFPRLLKAILNTPKEYDDAPVAA